MGFCLAFVAKSDRHPRSFTVESADSAEKCTIMVTIDKKSQKYSILLKNT